MKTAWLKVVAAALLAVAALTAFRLWPERLAHGNEAAAAAGVSLPSIDPNRIEPMQIGMSLASPHYFSSEIKFNDVIQNSAEVMYVGNKGWQNASEAVGFVKIVPGNHPTGIAKGALLQVYVQSPKVPLASGRYHCHISPGWTISHYGNVAVEQQGPTKFLMTVPEGKNEFGYAVTLEPAGATADLTDMGCVPEGRPGTWYPQFLHDIAPLGVLRYMDWMRTNANHRQTWADRPTPAFMSQAGEPGVALEHMVDIANVNGSDPWFNMPWDADADYYRNFAIYVRDHMAPGRCAYVELSNEVWNGSFDSSKAAAKLGKTRYPGVDESKATDYVYGDRVREVMKIWSEVFKGQEKRLVRVYSSQAGWPDRSEWGLAHNDTWRSVDALATAPYFGNDGTMYQERGPALVEAIFRDRDKIVGDAIGYAKRTKVIAAKYGLRYMTYEGGQGFQTYDVAVQPGFTAANRDPRMYDMYMLFLNRWKNEIGGLLMLYETTSNWGSDGYWGHLEYTGQPLSEAPKMRAVVDFIRQNGLRPGKS